MLDRIRRAYRALNSKSLYEMYPELRNRERLYTSGSTTDYTTMAIDNYAGYANVYKVYLWVRKATGLIVNNLSPLQVGVVDAKGKAAPDHWLSGLLTTMNPSADPARAWSDYYIYKLLGGEAFAEEVPDARGRPRELWMRQPDHVTILPAADLAYPEVAAYLISELSTPVDAAYVIHDMFPNPTSRWRGLGIPGALKASIVMDMTAQASDLTFFQKSARPDYMITTAEALTPDERKRLEIEVAEKYSGPGGWHKPGILEAGQGIEVLSFPPKDIQALEQRKMARDEVAAGFGVPDILMGFGNDSYDTEEKRKGAEAAFWTLTLLPLVQRRDAVFTWHYQQRGLLKAGERIVTDLSGVSALQEDILPKLEAAKAYFAMGVPYNVIEERLRLGTGPTASGAIGYLPSNVVPAGQVVTPPAPVTRSAASEIITVLNGNGIHHE